MSTIKRFEELDVWKLSRELSSMIGTWIDNGKLGRNFRLINQMEGSSGSIMDNIAEGFERGSNNEFIVFLGYSRGSCAELRSQLYRALDRQYISKSDFDLLYEYACRISAMLLSLISYLQKSEFKGIRKRN